MKRFVVLFATFVLVGCIHQTEMRSGATEAAACGVNLACDNEQDLISSEKPYTLSFSLVDVDGKAIAQTKFAGQILIAQGFASWCTSCAVEAEAIKKVYSKHRDTGLNVLYFDVMPQGESVEEVKEFRDKYGDSAWIWIAQASELPEKLGVRSLDYTAVLDKQGNVVYFDNRLTKPIELEAAVQKALEASN